MNVTSTYIEGRCKIGGCSKSTTGGTAVKAVNDDTSIL